MILGREGLVELEQIAKQQKQIYRDACDFGVEATSEMRTQIRNACKMISRDVRGKKSDLKYSTGRTRT